MLRPLESAALRLPEPGASASVTGGRGFRSQPVEDCAGRSPAAVLGKPDQITTPQSDDIITGKADQSGLR